MIYPLKNPQQPVEDMNNFDQNPHRNFRHQPCNCTILDNGADFQSSRQCILFLLPTKKLADCYFFHRLCF